VRELMTTGDIYALPPPATHANAQTLSGCSPESPTPRIRRMMLGESEE